MQYMKYSVLMSVYQNDDSDFFIVAMDSMLEQTLPPSEIVVVEDGSLPDELKGVIQSYCLKYPKLIRAIFLEENVGLGAALREGVPLCSHDWIVRMDADDYSYPTRCESQFQKLLDCHADIVGCDITEFMGTPENVVARRLFPETHEQLLKFSRKRTPFAHPAVIMRKSSVLAAGNYQTAHLHEDYDLFVRMLQQGCICCNLKETLVSVRINSSFYKRRGGMHYLTTMLAFNRKLLLCGWMRPHHFLIRSAANAFFGLIPNGARDFLYRRVLRK